MLQELTRWSLLTDEACEALMGSKPRLVKISALARPATMSRQSSAGCSSTSAGTGSPLTSKRKSSARGMLGRLSLGGSKKNMADVFAIEPSAQRPDFARDSSGRSMRSSFSSNAGGASARGGGGDRHHEAQDQQRQALFGEREAADGSGAAARDGGGGARRGGGGISETHAAVSEARDLAIERGEKLENMVDKSRQLEDSAMAFGEMAKQLRRQQEDESCCIS